MGEFQCGWRPILCAESATENATTLSLCLAVCVAKLYIPADDLLRYSTLLTEKHAELMIRPALSCSAIAQG